MALGHRASEQESRALSSGLYSFSQDPADPIGDLRDSGNMSPRCTGAALSQASAPWGSSHLPPRVSQQPQNLSKNEPCTQTFHTPHTRLPPWPRPTLGQRGESSDKHPPLETPLRPEIMPSSSHGFQLNNLLERCYTGPGAVA